MKSHVTYALLLLQHTSLSFRPLYAIIGESVGSSKLVQNQQKSLHNLLACTLEGAFSFLFKTTPYLKCVTALQTFYDQGSYVEFALHGFES